MGYHARAREAVLLAASTVRDPRAKSALTEDIRGAFEAAASRLLLREDARERMAALGATEDNLLTEVAALLAREALQGSLSLSLKRAGLKVRKR